MPYKDIESRRAAGKRHYAKHTAEVKAKVGVRNAEQRDRIKAYLEGYKSRPCADCRRRYPHYVMRLDDIHKQALVNEWNLYSRSGSLDKIRVIVEAAEVVCMNCLVHRTHVRGWTFTPWIRDLSVNTKEHQDDEQADGDDQDDQGE